MSKYVLPEAVTFDTDLETLKGYAKFLKIKTGKNDDERTIASAIIDTTNNFNDAQWDEMVEGNEALGYFVNELNTQIQELPAETPEPEPEETPEGEDDPLAIITADINGTKTKKATKEKAAELKKDFSIEVTFGAKDTVAQMQAKLVAAMEAKLAEPEEGTEPAPQTKATKPKPVRVKGDASAASPDAKEILERKKAAKAAAATGRKRTPRGANEGEPYREGTSSYVIWAALKKSRKKSTKLDDLEPVVTEMLKKENIPCTNIYGRLKTITSQMVTRGFAVKNPDDGYSIAQ